MLDNRGWGLGTFLAFSVVFIFFILVAAVNSYKLNLNNNPGEIIFSNNEFSYSNLENTLMEAGKRYFAINNKSFVVTSNVLIKENYINSLTDNNYNNCSGYVRKNHDNYKAYIKCGRNYLTTGYTEEYDK